jgi:hypothetical protein
MKRLRVCADDYGHSAAVDRGILALAAQGRVGFTSALVNLGRWPAAAGALADSPVQAGLHFNLTEGEALSPALRRHWPQLPPLGRLLGQALLRRLPAAIHDELLAQFAAFVAATGRQPAFLDGHQHVHGLGGVREGVLALAAQFQLPVRNTGRICGPGFAFKRQVIQACGGRALGAELRRQGLAHAPALVGVYGFSEHADYRAWMRRWLAAAPDGALLFCHPAQGAVSSADAIGPARLREAAYLGSEAFAQDLAEFGVSLDGRSIGD